MAEPAAILTDPKPVDRMGAAIATFTRESRNRDDAAGLALAEFMIALHQRLNVIESYLTRIDARR